jgi:hypothetical protein
MVRYDGENAASIRFADARDRSAPDAPWAHDVGLVEHHHGGRLLLRGMFAGHYLDVDESDHVSQSGAGEGAVVGGLVGVLAGPPGIALGLLVGGIVGSQEGAPSDSRASRSGSRSACARRYRARASAIVLFARHEVDEMLEALGDGAGEPLRLTLSDEHGRARGCTRRGCASVSAGGVSDGGAGAQGLSWDSARPVR